MTTPPLQFGGVRDAARAPGRHDSGARDADVPRRDPGSRQALERALAAAPDTARSARRRDRHRHDRRLRRQARAALRPEAPSTRGSPPSPAPVALEGERRPEVPAASAVRDITTRAAERRARHDRVSTTPLKPKVTRKNFGPVIVIRRGSNRLFLYNGMRYRRFFGVATGQSEYPTPLGRFEIVVKWRNPWWYPPNSPWAQGQEPVPPGPDNPLGTRWMGLSAPGVGIHGTPSDGSIGYSASHGCIRMHIPRGGVAVQPRRRSARRSSSSRPDGAPAPADGAGARGRARRRPARAARLARRARQTTRACRRRSTTASSRQRRRST